MRREATERTLVPDGVTVSDADDPDSPQDVEEKRVRRYVNSVSVSLRSTRGAASASGERARRSGMGFMVRGWQAGDVAASHGVTEGGAGRRLVAQGGADGLDGVSTWPGGSRCVVDSIVISGLLASASSAQILDAAMFYRCASAYSGTRVGEGVSPMVIASSVDRRPS